MHGSKAEKVNVEERNLMWGLDNWENRNKQLKGLIIYGDTIWRSYFVMAEF